MCSSMAETKLADYQPTLVEVACDLCGGRQFAPFHDKMRHGINLPTVLCRRCGLAQTNPRPDEASLATFYERFYHSFHGRNGIDDAYLAKSARMAKARLDYISRKLDPAAPLRVLEIGPGAGQFLKLAGERTRWSVQGVEHGAQSFQWCKSLGLNVVNSRFEDFVALETFDLVVAFQVMEHLASPLDFLKRCRTVLGEQGQLFLEVPDLERPGTIYADFLQLPHLYSFTEASLATYLTVAGFEATVTRSQLKQLGVVGQKTDRPAGAIPQPDVESILNRLRARDRMHALTRFIPRWAGSGRLRGWLEDHA
jgi:SAM-dependent methyltransferase